MYTERTDWDRIKFGFGYSILTHLVSNGSNQFVLTTIRIAASRWVLMCDITVLQKEDQFMQHVCTDQNSGVQATASYTATGQLAGSHLTKQSLDCQAYFTFSDSNSNSDVAIAI